MATDQERVRAVQGGRLGRAAYEALCAAHGCAAQPDATCLAMVDGEWDLPTYGVDRAVANTLASRRGWDVRAAREAAERVDDDAVDAAFESAWRAERAQDADDRY